MSRRSGPKQDPATGLWGFVTDAGFEDGRRKQARRRGFRTKKEAQAALDLLRVNVAEEEYIPPANLTVAEFFDRWLEARKPPDGLKAGTWESYARNVRVHIAPRLGQMRLQRLDAQRLTSLYGELRGEKGRRDGKPGGLSVRSTRYIHTIIRRALRDAVKWKLVRFNVAADADPPDTKNEKPKRPQTWTAKQLASFLAGIPEDRYRPALFTLATTGARRGEALALKWSDVDLDTGLASIRRTLASVAHATIEQDSTKTGDDRDVMLDVRTLGVLRAWKAVQAQERLLVGVGWRDQGWIFTRPDGRSLDPEEVSRAFDKRVTRLGLPRVRLHDLRHGWATLALAAGIAPKLVAEQLGHKSIAITLNTYTHVSAELAAGAAQKVADLMFGEGGKGQ